MSEFKGTRGPWRLGTTDRLQQLSIESSEGRLAICYGSSGENLANAKVMAAAPDLLKALKLILDNAEQRSFEDWLSRTTPGGDCESVHAQWLECGEYEDFANDWAKQLAAIDLATA